MNSSPVDWLIVALQTHPLNGPRGSIIYVQYQIAQGLVFGSDSSSHCDFHHVVEKK